MKIPALMGVAAASLLTLSACGSSSSTTAAPAGGGSATNTGSTASGLHAADTALGKVLVDANGHTVYMFSPDSPGKSTCDSSCLQYWPPVTSTKAASSVTGKVASTATTAGGTVATVSGWPVYTFIQDQKPGDVTGEGFNDFGGVWYAVSPAGHPVMASGSSSSSSSSSAPAYGGGGY